MTLQQAVPNLKGFDCNRVLTPATATAFHAAGYRFVVRYVPRISSAPGDLSTGEREVIHAAGLALMPVQHVKSDKVWQPNPDLGTQYGIVAAAAAAACHIVPGTTLWCDLEGVDPGTAPDDVRDYCNNWARAVNSTGYQAGLYVGWHALLNPAALYALAFTRYWAAYNLNGDQYPATRGVCMRQRSATPADMPASVPWLASEIDLNVIQPDALGGMPAVDAPDAWQTEDR